MAQTIFTDLSAANQAAWYNGSPPTQTEVSYRGTATTGAPVGSFDLFTSFVHEVGHVLGLSHTNMAMPEVQNDAGWDFDVDPDFVDGASMAVAANQHGDNPGQPVGAHRRPGPDVQRLRPDRASPPARRHRCLRYRLGRGVARP